MAAKAHPYLNWEEGRDPDSCLAEYPRFQDTPLEQRVVSSTFKPRNRFGDYRIHENVDAMCNWVLSTAPSKRHFNVVLLHEQPVRMYLDLDRAIEGDIQKGTLEIMLNDVRQLLEEAFVAAYPSQTVAGLCSDQWWYFSASNATKASFHIHADPDTSHPVWSSAVELGTFMKKHVEPRLMQEWRDGTDRAKRLALNSATAEEDMRSIKWFIDFSVYSRTRSLKLPLCSKPDKTSMTLHRSPSGVRDISERKQLRVGIPQLWSSLNQSGAPERLLPDLAANGPRAQFAAGPIHKKRNGNGNGNGAAATGAGVGESEHALAQRAAVVMKLLHPACVGSDARWHSFHVDAAARTASGTLAKQSARCPFAERIHNSNQLKVSIENEQLFISCWAPGCKHKKIHDKIARSELRKLFDDAGIRADDESDDGAAGCAESGMSIDAELQIEDDILRMQAQEEQQPLSDFIRRESQDEAGPLPELANFGMPLRREAGVRTLNRRYLLPQKWNAPEAEQQMNELMAHARLGIRSPMDTAKSSAFILYIAQMLELFPGLRVLLVSSRMTLAESLKQRLTEAGVRAASYLDCDRAQLRREQVVIVQLDSIHKLEGVDPYQIVLVDECESALFHFHAKTLKHRSDVWQTLRGTIEQATQLILLDASLGCRSQDFLRDVVPKGRSVLAFAKFLRDNRDDAGGLDEHSEVRIWVNECRTDDKQYSVHSSGDTWHAVLHDLLMRGKTIAIASNICRKAKELQHEIRTAYPALRVLLIESSSGQEDKLANCNTKWVQYDVVIYTPAIGAGVDFNPPSGPHFDAVLAWGSGGSNPAREFLQMVGRVRKVKDGNVHLHFNVAGLDNQVGACTRESIIDEIDHCWDTLNHNGLLDPAMRQQLVDDNGAAYAKFHEPFYRELYIHNQLEQRHSQQGLFAKFILHAIKSNLVSEKGGCITEAGAAVSIESKQIAAHRRRAAEEVQSTNHCWQMAAAQFASHSEETASRERVSMQRSTAVDQIMVQRQHIVHTYNLQKVRMVKEVPPMLMGAADQAVATEADSTPAPAIQEEPGGLASAVHSDAHLVRASAASAVSAEAVPRETAEHMGAAASSFTATFAALIREHGETAPFHLFCRAQEPLAVLWNRWKSKVLSCPGEAAMQLPQWDQFEAVRLLKGLLRVTSFTSDRRAEPIDRGALQPAAAAADWMWKLEDEGDLCCLCTVDTIIVERSMAEPETTQWLHDNAKWIQSQFGCALRSPYAVTDVIRALRAALKRVGIPLTTTEKKTIPDANGGPVRTVSSWTLASPCRDSMLELAYSKSHRHRPAYYVPVWDVAATLQTCQPAFRWQMLTGLERPVDWRVVDAGNDGSTHEKMMRKRKRKTKEDTSRSVCSKSATPTAGSMRAALRDEEEDCACQE